MSEDKVFTHGRYKGSCEYSVEDDCFHGKILNISNLITYESATEGGLYASFCNSVDRYVAYLTAPTVPEKSPGDWDKFSDLVKSLNNGSVSV